MTVQQGNATADRPGREFETGTVTKWMRRLSLGLTAVVGIVLIASYPSLPEEIPTHFNFAGEADGWGPRSSVFLLLAIFTVLSVVLGWLSTRPQIFNYPFVITEQNAQACYREGERAMVWISSALTAIYAMLVFSIVFGFEPGGPLILVPLAGVLVCTGVGVTRMFKAAH